MCEYVRLITIQWVGMCEEKNHKKEKLKRKHKEILKINICMWKWQICKKENKNN